MEQQTLDVTKIDDLNELKALAYDQLALKERTEDNLKFINARIRELTNLKEK